MKKFGEDKKDGKSLEGKKVGGGGQKWTFWFLCNFYATQVQ